MSEYPIQTGKLRGSFIFILTACSVLNISCNRTGADGQTLTPLSATTFNDIQRRASAGEMDSLKKIVGLSYNELHDKQMWRRWTRAAAVQGDPNAQESMFEFLIEDDTEFSVIRAGFWLDKAGEKGNPSLRRARLAVYQENALRKNIQSRKLPVTCEIGYSKIGVTNFDQIVRSEIELKALTGDQESAISCSAYWFKKGQPVTGIFWMTIAAENGHTGAKTIVSDVRLLLGP